MHPVRIQVAVPILILAASAFAADIPKNPEAAAPGMERGSWGLENWGNSGSAEKQTANGQRLLKLIYEAGNKDKAAFKHLTCFGMPADGKLKLNVYCDEERPPQFSVALSTTPAYRWIESRIYSLKKGWNKLEFKVGSKDWKTESTNWKYEAKVEPLDDIRAVTLVVYNNNSTGVVYVGGIQYDPDERGRKIEELAKRLQSDDVEERSKAEKELVAIGRPATEALYALAEDERPEVMLRAASALRQIENAKEEPPPDPAVRLELEKQKEAQSFDELRRRAEYTLRSLETQRVKLLSFMQEAQQDLTSGRAELEKMKHVDVEKRKAFSETLDKMEAVMKDVLPLLNAQKPIEKEKKDEMKK